ncbi:MAG: site-2 protease family protein [Gemmatimonadota bacterium]
MNWSFRIFRVAGTDVKVHVTFLLLLVYLGFNAYSGGGQAELIATLAAVLGVFACILLHEFGHITMARRFGVLTPDVILLPIGGVARLQRMPDEPRQELLIALAGPAVTLAIAAGLLTYLRLTGDHTSAFSFAVDAATLPGVLFQINVFLLLFNLIPAFPMDGGRVLRSLLAMRIGLVRATRAAVTIGQTLAFVMGIGGWFLTHEIMLPLIGFFVFLGAGAELAAVETRSAGAGMRVGDMMMTHFRTIPLHARLDEATRMLLEGDQREFPAVDNNGKIEGVLSRENLIKGLTERGPLSTVEEAMSANLPQLDPGEGFEDALARIKQSGAPALPVVDRTGALIGLLSLDNIAELIQVRNAIRKDDGRRTR